MSTVETDAIAQMIADLEKHPNLPDGFIFAGSVGDTSHLAKARTVGTYHIGAADCGNQWGHLYSLTHPEDIAGGKAHENYASAADFHWSPSGMILVTKRLIASAIDPNDHRLDAVVEIAGTTNGTSVHAYDNYRHVDDPNNTEGWDDGHLTHNHLSFARNKCYDYEAIRYIPDVICGVPLEDEVTPADIEAIGDSFAARFLGGADGKPHQILTLDKMAVHAERNPFIVQFPKAPKNPGAVYLVTGGALLWLQPADYTGEGAPTVSPIVDHTTSAIYKLPILTGTPDPRI